MLWTGPTQDRQAASSNFIALALHRRAGRYRIAYDLSHDGRIASVYRMQKTTGGWHMNYIGEARGRDTLDTCLNVALDFTPLDSELAELGVGMIEQRANALVPAFAAVEKRIDGALNELAGMLHV